MEGQQEAFVVGMDGQSENCKEGRGEPRGAVGGLMDQGTDSSLYSERGWDLLGSFELRGSPVWLTSEKLHVAAVWALDSGGKGRESVS